MNQTIIFDMNQQQNVLSKSKRPNIKSYTSVIHHPRRLGSGSACERCRSRKTKCDGGRPCAFCVSHSVPCIHRPSNRKRKLSPRYRENNSTKEHGYILNPFQQQQGQQQQPHQQEQGQEQRKQSYFNTLISSCNSISSHSSSSRSSVNSIGAVNETNQHSVGLEDTNASNSWVSASLSTTAPKIPSIMDQLSCHTFTVEAAYSSCNVSYN